MKEKFVGILGGMGPDATGTFFQNILRATAAKSDQDHFRILIYNNPKIPDRTAAILGNGADPLPELIASAKLLEHAGVDFMAIPCVTAHCFYDGIRAAVGIPILHIVKETLQYAAARHSGCKTIGLLATSGTIRTGLFQQVADEAGIAILSPTDDVLMQYVMPAVYHHVKAGVLTGEPTRLLQHAAGHLIRAGARAIVAGCTEIPLALQESDVAVPLLDPLRILAQAVVREAKRDLHDS